MNHSIETLVRCCLSNKHPSNLNPEKVILIGSGAIENSYLPLETALKNKPPIKLNGSYNGIYEKEIMHGLANTYFSYKTARDKFLLDLCNTGIISSGIISLINGFPEVRLAIANQYRNANLTLKQDMKAYLYSQDWNTTAVITTNWDETLWNDDNIKNLVQLHGRAQYDKTLIMPTEFTTDEIVFNLSLKSFDIKNRQKVIDQLEEIEYRNAVDNCTKGTAIDLLKSAHDVAINWLERAKEIEFIGIAMNIYDAELNSVVFSGAVNKWESVKNWNIDSKSDLVIAALTLTDPKNIEKLGRRNRLFRCFKNCFLK